MNLGDSNHLAKHKWSSMGDQQSQLPFCLGLGHSLGSSDSKESSGTACKTLSSAKETKNESSMDIELNLSLQLSRKNPANSTSKVGHTVDLELSLSSRPAESNITTSHPTKSTQQQNTKICKFEGCRKGARDASGLCIRHGGGKRCRKENCTKSAEGLAGLCISHGGGSRCQYLKNTKEAQGSTMLCKAHGGGKQCTLAGCTKDAEGSTPFRKGHSGGKRCPAAFGDGGVCPKSVHIGTRYCVAQGGGKQCVVAECTKSERGRTDFCVRHGGGKRCKFFQGCKKSAQGRTDYCEAHGGGKRSHGALVEDTRVYGGSTVGVMVHDLEPRETEKVGIVDIMNLGGGFVILEEFGLEESSRERDQLSDLEGRVHGGSLGALFSGKQTAYGAPAEQGNFT